MSPEPDADRPQKELSELLKLDFPADTEAIGAVTDAISEVLAQLSVPEQKRLEIELAVQEALVNAVVHGCQSNPMKQVRCRLQSDPQGRIVVIVSDPGPGFNPELLADPKHPENVLAGHGRGVYLIRQLMDEVHYEKGGNEIRMWKY